MKNKIRLFTVLFALAFVQQLTGQNTINGSFEHNGIMRTYSVYIPASYQEGTPVPLVLNLHGRGSTGQQQAIYSNFQQIADTANFIIVHPNGTTDPTSSQTFWNIGLLGTTVDDVGFLSDLIDTMTANYSIIEDRIYSTGISNGGYMSYVLACQTNKFRAIASVAGSMTNYMYNNCINGAGIPVMQIHGTSDATVLYNGDTSSKSIDEVVMLWVNKNNCNTTPITTQIPNTNTTDGATAERFLYSGGTDNHTVELFKVTGGGHSWPGAISLPSLGNTCQDFSASKEIWRFFSQYTNVATISVETVADATFQIYPNPTQASVTIQSDEPFKSVTIFTILGKKIQTIAAQNNTLIDLSHLSKGTYLFQLEGAHFTETRKVMIE